MNAPTTDSRASPVRHHPLVWVVVCILAMLVLAILWWSSSGEAPQEKVWEQAQAAFSNGDFEQARGLADQLITRVPDHTDALLLSAHASLSLGLCSEGEKKLRRVLTQNPANAAAHLSLVRVLKIQGRYWELHPHALSLFRTHDSGSEFLIPLAAPDGITLSESEFQQAKSFRSVAPEDTAAQLGLARHSLWNSETRKARRLLQKIVSDSPDNTEAQVQLGTTILRLNDIEGFQDWHSQLPEAAERHPEIWFLRGTWALRKQQITAAIRCFGEAILRDANHRRANFQLSQTLVLADETPKAKPFSERFERLEEAARLATRGNDSSGSEITSATMFRIASLMETLGRLRESAAWHRQAVSRDRQGTAASHPPLKVARRINHGTPLTLKELNPIAKFNLSSYPLPDWDDNQEIEKKKTTPPIDQSTVSFVDVASATGLSFRFQNGANPNSGLARMFEFSGGGVAAVDFDGDLWPDVYLTQGNLWPSSSSNFQDRLFRNRRGEEFSDSTERARLGDENYSQGPTVGDFDNDGFADIAVANVGANRLYHNNGDGTFSDLAADTEVSGNAWTSSCLLADLNGDALPDFYHVNYLGGDDVFTRKCDRQGVPIQCPLQHFPSAQDQLFVNLGDGRFRNVTETCGIKTPEGKGMGIVAADFHGTGQLSLFVGNDDKPNFFFVNEPNNLNGEAISFSDQGVVSGLAFSNSGDAQSSMGIAAGDANNDGRLDFFVTNFSNEANNYYAQQPGVFFVDASEQAGLSLAGLRPMGWGTQFLDGDLDGLPDLIVANGHLDENTSGILPYRMPTQYFRNLGEGEFSETPAHVLGSYFRRAHAGRAVAAIDWNRDGADDACITHVDEPVALLSNTTVNRGHYLVIHLRGVTGSRDAIGSVVRIKAGGQTWYRHLTAGDGFQASNERKLVFGFGEQEQVDEMEIRWPSGTVQVFVRPALDSEILISEGRAPRALPK